MKVTGFDWDSGNCMKCQKHGICIENIEALFKLPPMVLVDYKHSSEEPRWLALGQLHQSRWIIVAFTFRMQDGVQLIRPISARYMHKKEVSFYGQLK